VSEVSLTDEASDCSAAEPSDAVDDVWSSEAQSSVVNDDDETAPVSDAKRGSQDFHDDILHIRPYVKLMSILSINIYLTSFWGYVIRA